MDLKLFFSTFAAVFLAEIGDKTNLATMTLAAGAHSRWIVFAGASAALIVASGLGVLVGDSVARVVPPEWLRRAAGAVFVVLGMIYLLTAGESSAP